MNDIIFSCLALGSEIGHREIWVDLNLITRDSDGGVVWQLTTCDHTVFGQGHDVFRQPVKFYASWRIVELDEQCVQYAVFR